MSVQPGVSLTKNCIGNLAFEETFGQIWHICYLSKEIYMTIDIFLVMVIGGSWWWWLVAVVCGEMVVMMRPVHLHDLIQQLVCFLQVHLGKNSMAPPPTLLITRSLIQYFLNTANTSKTSTTQTTTIEDKLNWDFNYSNQNQRNETNSRLHPVIIDQLFSILISSRRGIFSDLVW